MRSTLISHNLSLLLPETRLEFLVARDRIHCMSGLDGVDVLDGKARRPRPAAVPLVFFLNYDELEYPHLKSMLQSGSHGYVLAEVAPDYDFLPKDPSNPFDYVQGLIALSARAFL